MHTIKGLKSNMNIFYLHEDPIQNAKWHIDKHIVKMPIEYAQLMSTAHRMLDGEMYIDRTANNRRIKRWRLNDERESVLYKASHINHPSAVWVRESVENYNQMYKLYMATLAEYTNRYGKIHGSTKPSIALIRPPKIFLKLKEHQYLNVCLKCARSKTILYLHIGTTI